MTDGYNIRREGIYEPLRREGSFTWDWMYGQEYALATLHTITKQDQEKLQHATEELGKIFARTMAAVQTGDAALLLELSIPAAAIAAVCVPFVPEIPTLIGRFDFARTPDGWKLLEFNSDTPGGVVEAFYVNGKVCAYYGGRNPNAGLEADLTAAFRHAIAHYQQAGYKTDNVFFSALDWHAEDAGTARYLLRCSGLAARFVPLQELRVYDDALYAKIDDRLEPVDVLYRLHPLGIMAEEQDPDGYPTGAHILDLAARKKLALINPPSALISQTKALQALIWNLYERETFFTEQEQAIIAAYMLPTYFENRFINNQSYVTKPVFGREGGAVTIHEQDGSIIERDRENRYWEQALVYQRYVALEQLHVETGEGVYPGHVIWGVFLIDGKASAVSARVGGLITDDLAYFLPLELEG